MDDTNGKTLKYRVGQLEKSNDKVSTKVDKILQNHLPHINEEIIALKTRVTVTAVFNVGAIILGIVISKLF